MAFTTNLEMIDLMDELKRRDVIARRLALAFTICCATSTVSAGDVDSQQAQAPSISRLLTRGWSSPTPLGSAESEPAADLDSGAALGGSVMHRQSSADEHAQLAPSILHESGKSVIAMVATEQHDQPAQGASLADLITRGSHPRSIQHQGLRPLHPEAEAEPLVLPSVTASSESKHQSLVDDEVADAIEDVAKCESLADFLRAHRDLALQSIPESGGSQIEQNAELCNEDNFVAPTRRPLPTSVEPSSNLAHTQLRVRSAPEIAPEPMMIRKPDPAGKDASGLSTSRRSGDHQTKREIRMRSNVPTFVSVPPRIVSALNDPSPASHTQPGPGALEAASETSVNVPSDSTEAKIAQLEDAPPVTALPTPVRDAMVKVESVATQEKAGATNRLESHPNLALDSVVDRVPSEPPAPLRDPAEPSIALELLEKDSHRRDDQGEYAILPIPSLEIGQSYAPPIPLPPPTPSVTLHTTRLLELAQHSVHQSQQSLQRGATHTARKHAIEAMQAIVALRDAQEGGNLHSQQLERAFDAIRESKDFCGEFGSIDSRALGRMVIVHETRVLKEQDLEVITALEATEAYLDFAKDQLALAAGGIREGSQALLLLGQIELQLAKATDTHSTSVAVAVQRAAVAADPYFATGYRVLGSTLLNLGLVEEAADCLITSLQIQPTRLAYERLLDVARRLGDVDTARTCMKALEDPRMEEGNLVRSLTPQEFAETNRPISTAIQPSRSSSKSDTTGAQSKPAARIGFSSLFPFVRR